MLTCRVDNLAAEGLAEAMAAKVFDVKIVASLNTLKVAIYHLRRVDNAILVKEAIFIKMFDI